MMKPLVHRATRRVPAAAIAFALAGCVTAGRMRSTGSADQVGDQATAGGAEARLRALEQTQVEALLRHDFAALQSNWGEEFIVNYPGNVGGSGRGAPGSAAPVLSYASFVRDVDRVLVRGNTAVVMGRETVVTTGSAPGAGQPVVRRFTDVWMQHSGRWLLTARHAGTDR